MSAQLHSYSESCDDGQSNFIAEGEIIAVLNTDDYTSCISCKGKVRAVSDLMGECLKCDAKLKLACCGSNTSIKFVVESKNPGGTKT